MLLASIPRYKKIGVIGYLSGAAAVVNFVHQQLPLLEGDSSSFDHGANLANAATLLISAVALLTSAALKEVDTKLNEILKNRDQDKASSGN